MPYNKQNLIRYAFWSGAAVLLALAQFRMVSLVLGPSYIGSIEAAKGIVQGLPHWVIYQSRVLGPYTVEVLSKLFNDFFSAHVFYMIAMTAIAGFLILALSWRRLGEVGAWRAFLLFHLLFSLLLSKTWLYAWDHIGIIVFILFIHFVIRGKDWRWFAGLFAIAIFNRESAFYIGLWMVLNPMVMLFLDRGQGNDKAPLNWKMLTAGLACMLTGFGLIQFLRAHLLVREIGPAMYGLPHLAGKSVHLKLEPNIEFVRQTLMHFDISNIVIPLFVVVVIVLAVVLALRDPRRYLALSMVHLALVASIVFFALLFETRVMLELVPFVAIGFAGLGISGRRENPEFAPV